MNFFHRAPASAHPPIHGMLSTSVDRTSTSSHSSSNFELEMNDERIHRLIKDSKEEKIYVAVPSDSKEWKANLLWVLQNTPRTRTIVILHIHSPAKTIPFMGAYFSAEHLAPAEVSSFKQMEAQKMNQNIAKYLTMCSRVKVKAELLITSMEDVAEGILTLISQRGITELVMGAAADRHYSKLLKAPTSMTAITVHQHADQACKIWFLCKGKVICTREAVSVRHSLYESNRMSSSSSISSSSMSGLLSDETPSSRMHNYHGFRSSDSTPNGSRTTSFDFDSSMGNAIITLSSSDNYPAFLNTTGKDLSDANTLKSESNRSTGSHVIKTVVETESSSGLGYSADYLVTRSNQSDITEFSTRNHFLNDQGINKERYVDFCSKLSEAGKPHHVACMETLRYHEERDKASKNNDVGVNKEMYMDFHNMLSEVEKLRHEAYMETFSCRKEEIDKEETSNSAKIDGSFHPRDVIKNSEQKAQIQQPRNAHRYEEIRRERNEMIEQLQIVQEQTARLELEFINCKSLIEELEDKLSEAHCMLASLEQEQERLQQGRDSATREIQQLRDKIKELENSLSGGFAEFTYAELQDATNNFDDSLKIGEGGYGSVYKGVLQSIDVAIKLLNPQGMQGKSEFHKEMEVLSNVRHPHLVTLIGTCPEAWALVYEFLPNGNLEDRLNCKGNTPPLMWPARCRIAAEICSALVFLHTLKPLTVIHGDLKPANILLDANFISRLGDFGICRLLEADASTILFRCTHPMGTFAYMDPEFVASGELRPSSDVYAFGIILLRLLTGRPAMGIINKMRDAVDGEMLHSILDKSAGEWPFDLAMQLAELGLRCCEIKRKNRPDLGKEAWKILEPLMQA